MKKILLLSGLLLLVMSCSTNKDLVEYNRVRMDRNEAYLNSVENKKVPKGDIKGKTTRVPLEKEAEKWSREQ